LHCNTNSGINNSENLPVRYSICLYAAKIDTVTRTIEIAESLRRLLSVNILTI